MLILYVDNGQILIVTYKMLLVVRDRYSIVERSLRINFLRCQSEKITTNSHRAFS